LKSRFRAWGCQFFFVGLGQGDDFFFFFEGVMEFPLCRETTVGIFGLSLTFVFSAPLPLTPTAARLNALAVCRRRLGLQDGCSSFKAVGGVIIKGGRFSFLEGGSLSSRF